MAAASSAAFFGLGDTQMQPPQASLQQQNSAAAQPAAAAVAAAPKKKRNQPGNPNPDAEVIALSPRTLLATNRFVCEVCNKGFQREQNLQLHRRGHNLPWKLKQKNPKENRRKVYLCPEPTCVHHDPSRALGDLTGIKKHYCRKHGEKKWKCDKCNKRYAVQSDWKAHSKTCGTREYRCDCGTLFSRRDSFITHRAFCDALARESAHMPPLGAGLYVGSGGMALGLSGAAPQMPIFADHQAQSSSAAQFDHMIPSPSSGSSMFHHSQASGSSSSFFLGGGGHAPSQDFSEDGDQSQGSQHQQSSLLHGKPPAFHGLMQLPEQNHGQPGSSNAGNGNNLLNLGFFSGNNSGGATGVSQDARLVMQDQFSGGSGNAEQRSMIGNHLGGSFASQLYNNNNNKSSPGLAQNSATALLLKAAQMGSTSSNPNGPSALLRAAGFGGNNGQQGSNRAAGGEDSSAHESHFHDLIMNSLAGSATGFAGVDDGKLSTRDFLGVGGRGSMAPLGLHIGSLDPAQMK
ncbi:hypothetical protein EJB05_43927 [Eragrostis curvula]|uniref:Protein EARLY HEADING DATE 2 n=1 Tax=Eragrostis curvula TaxID=38414 RepID=A0A5J9TI79_9POAL|nr:hypothetical protein EJB05_43927 [Eragrostis curvula]